MGADLESATEKKPSRMVPLIELSNLDEGAQQQLLLHQQSKDSQGELKPKKFVSNYEQKKAELIRNKATQYKILNKVSRFFASFLSDLSFCVAGR